MPRCVGFATFDEDWPATPELLGVGYPKDVDVGNGITSLLPMRARDLAALDRAPAVLDAPAG